MVLGANELTKVLPFVDEPFRCPFFIFSLLSPRKVFPVSEIIMHEGYTYPKSGSDIALIRVDEPVDLDVYSPACLPLPNIDFAEHGPVGPGQTGAMPCWGGTCWTWHGKPWNDVVNELLKPDTVAFRWATVTGLLYIPS
jgi:hypothetical protein